MHESLERRVLSVAAGVHDTHGADQSDCDNEEEEVVEVSEAELLKMLDLHEPPLITCRALFFDEAVRPLDLLDHTAVSSLREHGLMILDSLLHQSDVESAASILRDPALLSSFKPACADADAKFTDTNARGDSILWLSEQVRTRSEFRPILTVIGKVIADLHRVMLLRREQVEYQLAHYGASGAQYERHRDALPDGGHESEQRRVTVITYLNSDWTENDGGCLRIWPPKGSGLQSFEACSFLHSSSDRSATTMRGAEADRIWMRKDEDGEPVMDVAPISGRVVIFLSGAVDHAVLPSRAHRFAITAWCR